MPSHAFISMPYGATPDSLENEWTKLYEYGLKPLEKASPNLPKDYRPVGLLRADRNLMSLGLKTNVKKLIEQSTLVIGVLTTAVQKTENGITRLSNPNVLWELGYAEALGKPIVVLADDESL